MNTEESMAEADRILAAAGWTPLKLVVAEGGARIPNTEGRFAISNLVAGHPPPGCPFPCAVKNLATLPQAMAAEVEGFDPADYPDEHHEAAALLVERFKANPLSTEATLEPVAIESEAGEDSAHESDSETGEALDGTEGLLEGADVRTDAGGDQAGSEEGEAVDGSHVGGELLVPEPIEFGRDNLLADAIDADFDAIFEETPDLGAELLDDEAFAHGELPAPDPLDFAPDEIEPEPEPIDRFYMGDNLAQNRIIRIGEISERAAALIAAAKAGYSDSEHDAVRSHVVTNLNEAGAYVGGNPKLFDRFIELETVTARIRRIEIYRDERQDFIRSADREAVAAFEPSAGWP